MRVMVTGGHGQLGQDTVKVLLARGQEVFAPPVEELDLTCAEAVEQYLKMHRPEAVIHCAAYTAVDKAETEADACFAVNATATETLAKLCEEIGAKLLYLSTDYVFDGSGTAPFETDAVPAPLNVYGKSKLLGEEAVLRFCSRSFVVRISWVFGEGGGNFVKTVLRLADCKEEISVVDDQVGSPTYTKDLAPLLCDMIETDRYGIYHATNEGFCSFFEFAKEIVRQSGKTLRILPTTTEAYGAPAPRPKNSRLSKKSLKDGGFSTLRPWQEALSDFVDKGSYRE